MISQDMEAVKKFIYTEHQAEHLNMNKMGIVGPEMGATIAAYYAAVDWEREPHPDARPGFETPNGQDVRALVLISPRQSFHGLPMQKAINAIRNPQFKIAFLFCVGKDDPQDSGDQVKKLYEQATSLSKDKDDRIEFQEYPGKLKGTDLLGKNFKLEDRIVKFLDQHLQHLDAPWRDRQSKIDK